MTTRKAFPFSMETTVSLLLVLFAVAELYAAFHLPMAEDYTLGPGALPSIYGVGLLGFSLALLFESVRKAPAGADDEEATNLRGGLTCIALLALLIGAIYIVGFLIALIAFCFLFCLLISKLDLVRSAIFAVIWAGAVYFAFDYLLEIPLETGLLFS
ncbi:tripartite tricarboxylate transporter TctB family protein [Starkeya sp. ORNL1]|uniref:tripartite tricarboxylate transporter TctB family protein n=1 Tax=Starkeya sp. ORNL1 TaxID=2709380 RepID=UPI00146351B1|nr:tripartite tricarboxylate transporter TctB family protein [Starkeya sp. ORNL1]QJP14053.1 tripartite tricarboxylate transporter TctB family protein [Starkeya sp. ORNL1]